MDLTALTQPPWLYAVIAAAVIIVGLIAWALIARSRRRREREALQQRYGSEYDRTLAMHRKKRSAVEDLKERERLHDELRLRDLNDADLDLVRRHMAMAQYRFVEDPADVMLQTDRVLTEVLRSKGYPVAEDRDTAVRLFSVDHPEHAATVRAVLEGRHEGDVARMREVFLNVRKALAEVTGVSYVLGDAQPVEQRSADHPPAGGVREGDVRGERAGDASDVRVEHDASPTGTSTG